MFPANAYLIYEGTAADAATLFRLAGVDDLPAPCARFLIGEIQGEPAAAISLADDRVVADPVRDTSRLTPVLRMRAQGLRAVERVPSLPARLRAGVRVAPPSALTA